MPAEMDAERSATRHAAKALRCAAIGDCIERSDRNILAPSPGFARRSMRSGAADSAA
jgi:hypothetical protein